MTTPSDDAATSDGDREAVAWAVCDTFKTGKPEPDAYLLADAVLIPRAELEEAARWLGEWSGSPEAIALAHSLRQRSRG